MFLVNLFFVIDIKITANWAQKNIEIDLIFITLILNNHSLYLF